MICELRNNCETPSLCCAECKKKDCWQRCKDSPVADGIVCKWGIDKKYEPENDNRYRLKHTKPIPVKEKKK